MESVLPLVIGAAITCLAVILEKILAGSGHRPVTLDQKPPPKIHEQNAGTTPVARFAATPESSPEPMIAVVPAVEPSERPWLPRPERTIPATNALHRLPMRRSCPGTAALIDGPSQRNKAFSNCSASF